MVSKKVREIKMEKEPKKRRTGKVHQVNIEEITTKVCNKERVEMRKGILLSRHMEG